MAREAREGGARWGPGGGPLRWRNGKFDKSLQRPEEEGAGRSGGPAPPPLRPVPRRGARGSGPWGGERGRRAPAWEEARGTRPGGSCPAPAPRTGGSRHGGRAAAAASAWGSAVRSSARGATGAAASATGKLKGKGDDRVTSRPRGRRAPAPGPGPLQDPLPLREGGAAPLPPPHARKQGRGARPADSVPGR